MAYGLEWRGRRKIFLFLCTLLLASAACWAHAGDREEVFAVISQYMDHEKSGDLIAQGKLMVNGRSMVYPGGRAIGDNDKGMQRQQSEQNQFAAEFPGVRYEYELRDVQVQVWNADSAMVVFDSLPTRIVPPSLSPEKVAKLGQAKVSLIVAAMLVKQRGAWKIVHTTFVPK
ncbi:MAG: hypothetical protein ACREO0_00075 [Pseudoxanthomonas sp.]